MMLLILKKKRFFVIFVAKNTYSKLLTMKLAALLIAGLLIRNVGIGKVFEKVLTHAGVYKRTEEGMAAFDRFVAAVK